jgi:hypothetical protein
MDAWAQRPEPPTEEACAAYHRTAYSEWQQLSKAKLACMSATPPHITIAPECGLLSRQVHMSTQAWPHCSNPAQECATLIRLDDSYACIDEAKRNAGKLRDEDNKLMTLKRAEQKIRDAQEDFAAGMHVMNDPKQFFEQKLASYLKKNFLGDFSLDDARGQFTQRGRTVMQETYDYLFGHSAGDPSLRASNPIIAAIQGASADELRRVHSQTIHDLEEALVSMDDISRSAFSGATTARSKPATPAASARAEECAILDSPGRTRLAVDEPEKFLALSARCK